MNQTSGGITIVKLNVAPPPLINHQSTTLDCTTTTTTTLPITTSKFINGVPTTTASIPSHNITASGGHVVTIHTSSITSALASSTAQPISNSSSSSHTGNGTNTQITSTAGGTVTNGTVHPTVQPHTGGYTRRAKLGDSRSTGRLHSTGNTHRSMTRLNIAGSYLKFTNKFTNKLIKN